MGAVMAGEEVGKNPELLGTRVKRFLVGNRPCHVVFSPDSSRTYVSAKIGGTVSVMDTKTHPVVQVSPY
ncbi:MAG: hypothetical protein C4333_11005 [Meiothermus sp.]